MLFCFTLKDTDIIYCLLLDEIGSLLIIGDIVVIVRGSCGYMTEIHRGRRIGFDAVLSDSVYPWRQRSDNHPAQEGYVNAGARAGSTASFNCIQSSVGHSTSHTNDKTLIRDRICSY